MAANQITPAFKQEFGETLQNKAKLKANELFQACMLQLRKQQLVYTSSSIEPKFMLTHKSNRGGLMLSPHNAHRNAAKIHNCGADLTQLSNAVCFELAPSGPMLDEQISANETLIARSGGLLAPVNGCERYLSVGCGHTVAWCKLAGIGGATPQKAIQAADGTIDIMKITKNEQFKTMIECGWPWQVVSHKVDETFPEFAKVAQRALNTQNHLSSEVSELEAALTLADMAADDGLKACDNWQQLAVDAVVELGYPCADYAKHILAFVETFAGGIEAPYIKFMDAVAKGFQCNVNLGESFWSVISSTCFHDKTSKFPMLRVALALSNLTCDKIEDRVAKLIVRADVLKLAGKQMASTSLEYEKTLSQAMSIAETISSIQVCLRPLGQIFSRIGLLSTKKGKQGAEKKEYTLEQIKQMYLKSMSEIAKADIVFEPWGAGKKAEAPATESKSESSQTATQPVSNMASLSDHQDPEWVAERAGFGIGVTVIEKKQDEISPDGLFGIFEINASQVTLQQLCSYSGKPLKVSMTLSNLLNNWMPTKMEPPIEMVSRQQRPLSLDVDSQKASIFKALMVADSKSAGAESIVFWRRPDEVRTSKHIGAGALTLVPVAPLANISTKSNSAGSAPSLGKYTIGSDEVEFFVLSPSKPSTKAAEVSFAPEVVLSAYWWIGTTHIQGKANMHASHITENGIRIPIMTNSKPLGPFTKLMAYKARTACQTLKGATVIDAEAPEDAPTTGATRTATSTSLAASSKKKARKA